MCERPPAGKTHVVLELLTFMEGEGSVAVNISVAAADGSIPALVALVLDGSAQGKVAAAKALEILVFEHNALTLEELFKLVSTHVGWNASIDAAAGGLEPLVALCESGTSMGKVAAALVLHRWSSKLIELGLNHGELRNGISAGCRSAGRRSWG